MFDQDYELSSDAAIDAIAEEMRLLHEKNAGIGLPVLSDEVDDDLRGSVFRQDAAELSPMGRLALAYVFAKWRVVPLPAGGKNPAETLGEGWGKKAFRTKAEVERWWRRHPNHNVGIMPAEDVVILDMDCKNGATGLDDFHKIKDAFGFLPITLVAVTPSGGFHVHLKVPKGTKLTKATSAIKKLLGRSLDWDLKSNWGKDHVVVAPGSVLYETEKYRAGAYRWLIAPAWMPLDLEDVDWLYGTEQGVMTVMKTADAPQWLIDLFTKPTVSTSKQQPIVPNPRHHTHGEEEMEGLRNYDGTSGATDVELTPKIIAMLRGESQEGATPSEHFWACMVVMRNGGISYGQMKSEFRKESNHGTWKHVSKDGESQVEALIDREIIHHQQKYIGAATGAALVPAFEALLGRIQTTAWKGRAGAVDRAVLTWCVTEAMSKGNTKISASSRRIAQAVKHDRDTVSNSLRRLIAAGHLKDGGTWRMTQHVVVKTSALRSAQKTAGPALVTQVDNRPDAFAAGGLGSNAELLLGCLKQGPAVLNDLVAMTGLGKTTVYTNLQKMQRSGLVGQTGKRSPWALMNAIAESEFEMARQLKRVADETEQTDRMAAKQERMARETAGWMKARSI